MMNRLDRLKIAVAALSACAASGALAQIAAPELVETAPLAKDAFSTGTLTSATGALPNTLWRDADASTLEFLLEKTPARPTTPAIGEAMRRTLLSPGAAPDGASDALGGKKLLALAQAGFVDEAVTIASLSNAGRDNAWTGRAQAVGDLLNNDIDSACKRGARVAGGRDDPFWVKLRIVCYAASGEFDAADLSFGILRDQYGVSDADDIFLTAAATGAAPKSPPAIATPLHYSVMRVLEVPISYGALAQADGGVLVAVASDAANDPATRIVAARKAVAMGVMDAAAFTAILSGVDADVAAVGDAAGAAAARPGDPLTDALLYQSVAAMSAPEFARDKAKRIALALSLADSFPRAYALSMAYADEIADMEGLVVATDEAAQFAMARMATGDAVGAGRWLNALIETGGGVGALPEAEAMQFIDLVNLLSVLDPQTASQIARAGDVSLLNGVEDVDSALTQNDPVVTAHILEAAFDAALENKPGQAGLAALAASGAQGGPEGRIVVSQSLRAAGMPELRRRYLFERAWASKFSPALGGGADVAATPAAAGDAASGGLRPRIKPATD